ncbi:MAG: tRNA pseudouridine(55) synthase TruB [Nitrospirota bacterium]
MENSPLIKRDGILNINKSSGWTSHDVVARIRNLSGIKKVGHTGTLDPMATGVLPVCLGKGTKVVRYIQEFEKEYLAVARLGITTDTQDASGKVIKHITDFDIKESEIKSLFEEFVGVIKQIPPMYSAIKVKGVPLYKLARSGKHIERKPREVIIKSINIIDIKDRDITFEVTCSKGTYIRTLCADIGERLKVGGHLYRLIRKRVGPFRYDNAITVNEVEKLVNDNRLDEKIYPLDKIWELIIID